MRSDFTAAGQWFMFFKNSVSSREVEFASSVVLWWLCDDSRQAKCAMEAVRKDVKRWTQFYVLLLDRGVVAGQDGSDAFPTYGERTCENVNCLYAIIALHCCALFAASLFLNVPNRIWSVLIVSSRSLYVGCIPARVDYHEKQYGTLAQRFLIQLLEIRSTKTVMHKLMQLSRISSTIRSSDPNT